MDAARGKIIKGGKDRHGRPRKFVSIKDEYYDDYDFGDVVRIEKVDGS